MRIACFVASASIVVTTSLVLAPAPSQADGFTHESPRSASALVDSFGVGLHLAYNNTPYNDTARVAAALRDLGVHHVRDDLFIADPDQYEEIATVAASSVRFNLIAGRPGNGHTAAEYVDVVASLGGAVESIEGPNEWDNSGRSNWVEELRGFQTDLFRAARADPRTRALPVLSPALAFLSNYDALGDLTGVSTEGNGHLYTGGLPSSSRLDQSIDTIRDRTANPGVTFTETGYHNAVASDSGHYATPEDVAGTYQPRVLLEHALRGVDRVYTYELIDEFADAAHTNPESNFGLLRHDWTPKPAYLAMRNLIALLDGPATGSQSTPAPAAMKPLAYRLDTASSDVKHLLTQRADGAYVLFLWRDVNIYDPYLRTPIAVPAAPVEVRLDQPSDFGVFRPTTSAEALWEGTATSVNLSLDGSVSAVVLSPPTRAIPAVAPTVPTVPPAIVAPQTITATAAPIAKPKGLNVQIQAPRALLRWSHPEARSQGITGFKITVTHQGHRVDVISVGARKRRVALRGLLPGEAYRFTVRALRGSTKSSVAAVHVSATTPAASRA